MESERADGEPRERMESERADGEPRERIMLLMVCLKSVWDH